MTVKQKVKELYKKAKDETWTRFYLILNERKRNEGRCVSYDQKEDCPADSLLGFFDGPVLRHGDLCSDIPVAIKNYLTTNGFELKPQCFWCRKADGSASGVSNCHIKYGGRYLTADELWLTDLKQRAIDLGHDIRDCAISKTCLIGWGFWGSTSDDAYANLSSFCNETGVTMMSASWIKDFEGGSLYTISSFYIYGLYGITEPLPTKLNPVFRIVSFSAMLYPTKKHDVIIDNGFIPDVVVPIDPDVSFIYYYYGNTGDENIDISVQLFVDGSSEVGPKEHLNVAPGANIGIGTGERTFAAGSHTLNAVMWAKRTTETAFPTTPQVDISGTFHAYTLELNPVISKAELQFTDGTTHQLVSEGVAIPNVIVPAGVALSVPLAYCRNDGDETLHVKWVYDDDNMYPVSCTHTNLLPGQEESCGIGAAEIYASGEHTFSVTLYAARKGDPLPTTPTQTITGTFNAAAPRAVTCDINNCGSGYSTGCELLLHYDADNDGMINLNELNQSYSDVETGIITAEEFDFISDAYINGGINVVCTGCYVPPDEVTAEFYEVISHKGPFSIGAGKKIVEYKIQNTGTVGAYSGMLMFRAAELNHDGTEKELVCLRSTGGVVSVGGCTQFKGPIENPCRDEWTGGCDLIPLGYVIINLPTTPGTYYYGMKTWGVDESEPSYPVPDSLNQPMNAKAWSVTVIAPTKIVSFESVPAGATVTVD